MSNLAADIVHSLVQRHRTIAVAESITGGLLVAELIRTPGASAAVLGGIVAYSTELKHSLLGVDAQLLAAHGPVHADVAAQMAARVRERLAVDGHPAHIGVATTGVAGPDPQNGISPGVAYVGVAIDGDVRTKHLHLTGSRDEIRSAVAMAALELIAEAIAREARIAPTGDA